MILVLLIIPNDAKAVHEVVDSRCTDNIKLSLREEAKNVTYNIFKVTDKNDVIYTVNLYGLTDNLIIKDTISNTYVDGSVIKNVLPGTLLTLTIYASSNNYCEGYTIMTKTVQVPYYNKYSTSDLCIKYSDYSLCKENINISMTEEEFEKKMNAYILSIEGDQNQDGEDNVKDDTNLNFDIIGFIINYKNYISGFGGILLVIFITYLIEKSKKNRGIL